jgi:cell division protease FtsH
MPTKSPVDAEAVDGGVDSEPTTKPARTRPPRTTPGIATA